MRIKGISIFRKLLITFLGSIFLICIFIATVFYIFSRSTLQNYVTSQIYQQFYSIRSHFHDYFINILSKDLRFLSSDPMLDDYMMSSELEKHIVLKSVEKLFSQYISYSESYRAVYFVDSEGMETITIHPSEKFSNYRNFVNWTPFLKLKKAPPGTLYITAPYITEAGEIMATGGINKIDMDIGKVGGAIFIDFSLEPFLWDLKR